MLRVDGQTELPRVVDELMGRLAAGAKSWTVITSLVS